MNKIKKLLFLLWALLFSLSCLAYDAYIDGIYYSLDSYSKTATVTYKSIREENGYIGAVIIPKTVTYGNKTYTVTHIGSYAFYNCKDLTSITIPSSVTNIEREAFWGCSSLTSVTIPSSVTHIDFAAFNSCTSLKKVVVPSITAWCKTTFSVTSSNPLFYAHHLYSDEETEITDLVIPECVTSIGNYAFSGCSALTSVTIPESVTSIGNYALEGCSGLTSITIHEGVTSIGNNAFEGCINLISVTINCPTIGAWFQGMTSIQEVILGEMVTSISSSAFTGCNGLTTINIPMNVNSIGSSAFAGCSGLASIIIPNSVTTISSSAFKGCKGLTSIHIPDDIVSIGESSFKGCSGLVSINVPASVSSIGASAFESCSGLTKVEFASVERLCGIKFSNYASNPLSYAHHLYIDGKEVTDLVIPNSVTEIGSFSFYGCNGLTSITIPSNVTEIGDDALKGCSGLISVTIDNNAIATKTYNESSTLAGIFGTQVKNYVFGNDVKSIGSYACYNCNDLTSVTIGNSVTEIGSSAFSGCSGLTKAEFASVESLCGIKFGYSTSNPLFYAHHLYIDGIEIRDLVIPNGVTKIGNYSFENCSGLTSVSFGNSVTSIGSSAFYNCSGLTSVTIPNSVTEIASSAFRGCGGLTSVTIPNSVTSIGSLAFYGCSGLTSVTIPNSVAEIGNSAFSGCSGLTSVMINNNVIASNKYSSLSSLDKIFGTQVKSYLFGDEVKSIGAYACYKCSGLTSLTLGSSVTEIGDRAFFGCSGLTSIVVGSGNTRYDSRNECNAIIETESNTLVFGCKNTIIPNSVAEIGSSAFSGCSGLTSVTIPNSVTEIGGSAFSGCSGLKSIIIPKGVTNIGNYAFEGCSILTSVTINSNVIASNAYSNTFTLAGIFGKQVKNYIFGNDIQRIGDYACYNCSGLTSVTISNSVTEIGYSAFSGCSGLTKAEFAGVENLCGIKFSNYASNPLSYAHHLYIGSEEVTDLVIPNNVTIMGNYAFSGCSDLTSVTIPESVTSIGSGAFKDCSGLKKVIVPNIAEWCKVLFYNNSSNPLSYAYHLYSDDETEISDLVIPEGVASIGNYSFDGCRVLTSVTIPESVTNIGNNAFEGCSGLTSVTIPEGVTSIGNNAFEGCSSLTSVIIPESVTSIGNNAFDGCSSLTSITIPKGVTSIGNYTFSDCYDLTSITIPESVTAIGSYAFSCCYHLTSIAIPEGVTKIGDYACYKCRGLTSISIPEGVTTIYDFTFSGCSGLTSVTIPESVSSIGVSAFEGCRGLTSVTISEGVTSIGNNAFDGCSGLKSVTINCPAVGSWFQGFTSIEKVILGEKVTSIGNEAFYGCSNLNIVTLDSDQFLASQYTSSSSLKSFFGNQVETYIIGKHVNTIGDYAFYGCTNAKKLEIQANDLTSIGTTAFDGCNNMSIFVNRGSATLLAIWAKELVPYDITTKELLSPPMPTIQEQTATTFGGLVNGIYEEYDYQILLNQEPVGTTLFHQTGLEPSTEYTLSLAISVPNKNDFSYSLKINITTASLSFETLQPKVVTEGNVVVESISNIQYDEEKVGVEWRRTDWTDDFPSNNATAYLYEGTIQGYIRNLNTNYLWKFRPYYESAAGNRYYGNWMGVDPTNTSYFEPTVHTYAVKIVEGNQAQVKGYALTGTDKVISQGFAYWKVSANTKAEMSNDPAKAFSVPDDAMTVTAKGTVMEANLTGLEYNATYCYVAYVTTSEGETFYGEMQSFNTGDDLTPVESIVEAPAVVTIEAIYDASGRKQAKMQRGVNILRMSDGTTRKVMVK